MKIIRLLSLLLLGLGCAIATPALAAAFSPGFYSAPDPNITYTHITGISYHASGDPIYYFDAASWSVVGADQVQVYKNVVGGGGTLCMDGSVCQPFGFSTTFIVMDLPDRGVHSFTMTNGAITFIGVVYDGTPPVTTPTLTGTAGQNGWYRSPVLVGLTAVDAAGAFPSTLVSGVAGMIANGNPYTGPFTVSGEGANALTYQSTDNKGNAETLRSDSINIDTQTPTTLSTLSGTLGDNGWYTTPVSLALSAMDSGSGVSDSTLDGVPYISPVTISAAGPSTHTFFSTDVAGNIETSQTTLINIDTDLPVGNVIAPTAGAVAGGTWTVTGVASDPTSGLGQVQVSLDGGITWQDGTLSGNDWSFPLDTLTLPDGPATLSARGRDLAGNTQTFASLGLTIDNTPPVITLTAPETELCLGCGLNNTLALSFSASDLTTTIASWTLSIQGGPTLASGAGGVSSTFTWDGSGPGLGPQIVHFTATDTAGNTSEATLPLTLIAPTRTVSSTPVIFPTTALTGESQVVIADAPLAPWSVFNAFPVGTGWHVQLTATDLVAGTRIIPAANIAVRLSPDAIVGQSGASAPPATLISAFTPLSTNPLTIVVAGGADGIGAYTLTPEFQLTVPADAYAGNYTATLTLTIVSGP